MRNRKDHKEEKSPARSSRYQPVSSFARGAHGLVARVTCRRKKPLLFSFAIFASLRSLRPHFPDHYSCLSASIGFIRAACIAGYKPNPIPIIPDTTNDPITDQDVMLVG
jgi:hypothetical protein